MIGIFDSGIGGLTVARELTRVLPTYDIVYFGDTARAPYGDKSAEIIERYTREDIEFLINKGAQLIVAACHSSSVLARNHVWQDIKVPVFDMVAPTVAAAVSDTRSGRIGILGTRATVASGKYQEFILEKANQLKKAEQSEAGLKMPAYARQKKVLKTDKKYQVFAQAAPLLVPLVEEGWVNKPETSRIVKYYLRPLKEKEIDTLVLACTHYPLLKKMIEPRAGQKVKVIDPGRQVALALEKYLLDHPEVDEKLSKRRQRTYYLSDISPHFEEVARRWLGHQVKFELALI